MGGRWTTPENLADRLLAGRAVDPTTGCWNWTGPKHRDGYGLVQWRATPEKLIHRIAYSVFVGEIGGLHVLHRCDNPVCFNPDHLFLGTHADNMADMAAKGRCVPPVCPPERRARGERHGHAKLTADLVRAINVDDRPAAVIAAELGVSPGAIHNVRSGLSWNHLETKETAHVA